MSSSFNNKLARALISARVNLKSCKSVKFTFNPWQIETKSIRDFYHYIYSPKMRNSNEKCKLQADIRSDAIKPQIDVTFLDDTNAIFKTSSLTAYDIATEFQRLSALKAPKEEQTKNY